MDLHKQFKEETKQEAYSIHQTIWNEYYIEWLESKIQRVHDLELENKKLRQGIKILECEANITEYFHNRYPSYGTNR